MDCFTKQLPSDFDFQQAEVVLLESIKAEMTSEWARKGIQDEVMMEVMSADNFIDKFHSSKNTQNIICHIIKIN